jgi:hypothetical protein
MPQGMDLVLVPKRGIDVKALDLETVTRELTALVKRAKQWQASGGSPQDGPKA